jgi:hypothetical protein
MRAVAIALGAIGFGLAAAFAVRHKPRKPLSGSGSDYDEGFDPDDETSSLPRDEDECLILGKPHANYDHARYRVCLTPNQEQALFKGKRTKQKKLGCGVFACAYTAPGSTRVVKFTRDSEDVAALLKAQKSGIVPKVHAVYRLKQEGKTMPTREPWSGRTAESRYVPVYALVMERLRTIPSSDEEDTNGSLMSVLDVPKEVVDAREVCNVIEENQGAPCDDLQRETAEIREKLHKLGIKWTDIHAGNIGYDKHGKLKALDLGVSKTELKRRLKILEGLARSGTQPKLAGLRLI